MKDQYTCNKIMAKLIRDYRSIFEADGDEEAGTGEQSSPITVKVLLTHYDSRCSCSNGADQRAVRVVRPAWVTSHSKTRSAVCDSSFIFNTINRSGLKKKKISVSNCFSGGSFCLISVCHFNGWKGWLISGILRSVGFPGIMVLSVSLLQKEQPNMKLSLMLTAHILNPA